MFENNKILLLENPNKKNIKIKTIFDFIEQPTITLTHQDLKNKLNENCFAIFISDIKLDDALFNDLKCLIKNSSALAIIFLDEIPVKFKALDNHNHFMLSLNGDLSFITMQETLKKAKTYYLSHQTQSPQVSLYKSLVGSSRAINNVRYLIEQVANVDANVLILGESGTGKEITAQCIHQHSERNKQAFVAINCGAIPSELLESELFGHEKGAFTGAITTRKGRFELANGGTLFLDEIGDMPLAMQVKLLRVLQERKFERVGSNNSIEVDVRIIAATHRDLATEISNGTFREDLFYRLNVFPIEIPPLRQRAEDIPLLINELVSRLEQCNRPTAKLMLDAVQALCLYSWPGNIRELANTIERLSILHPNGIVDFNALPSRYKKSKQANQDPSCILSDAIEQDDIVVSHNLSLSAQGIDLKKHLMKTEISLITQALDETDWVVARAATCLMIRRTTLVEKIRKYGISKSEK